jgi:hypothetical protein
VLLVIVAEKEFVRALLAAEAPAHRAVSAVVADPFEADGAFVQMTVLIVDLAADAFHPGASLFDVADPRIYHLTPFCPASGTRPV